MEVQCKTVLYPVQDLDGATDLFGVLFGAGPHVESPYYVGFSVDGTEIGLIPAGADSDLTGPLPYFDVDDVQSTIAALAAAGATVVQEPTDVGGGLLVAKVVDRDANTIGLRQTPTVA